MRPSLPITTLRRAVPVALCLGVLIGCKRRTPEPGGSFEQLLGDVSKGDRAARLDAMERLVELGDKRAIAPLIRTYRDRTQESIVREVALVSAAELEDPQIFDHVMDELPSALARERRDHWARLDPSHVSSHMLGKAVLALGRQTLPRTIAMIDHPNPDLRDWAIRSLGFYRRESASLQALLPLMKSSEARIRTLAAASLGQLFRAEAEPALRAALADPDPAVRDVAAFSLRNVMTVVRSQRDGSD